MMHSYGQRLQQQGPLAILLPVSRHTTHPPASQAGDLDSASRVFDSLEELGVAPNVQVGDMVRWVQLDRQGRNQASLELSCSW